MFTLYSSVAGSLPPTAYVKVIEVWLLFHLFVPFLIFLIIFMREHNHKKESDVILFKDDVDDKANFDNTLKFLGEKVIPFVIFAFVTIYFAVCLTYYFS